MIEIAEVYKDGKLIDTYEVEVPDPPKSLEQEIDELKARVELLEKLPQGI